MKGQEVLFSSHSDSWSTPSGLYYELNKEFDFNFDPCPLDLEPKKQETLFTEDVKPVYDGLNIDWGLSTFCNPPYSEINKWIEKGFTEYKKGKCIVFLVPSRTDTKWFHKYVLPHAKEIRFIKGRLKFGTAKNSAPFPSMIIIFNK